MYITELTNYRMNHLDKNKVLSTDHFILSAGDICSIESDSADHTRLLLRALATLSTPVSGQFRFMGELLNFADYRRLLPFKKKIGYIGPDAAMLSNRTIRENLLLNRYYFENNLAVSLGDWAEALCRTFNIAEKLDFRPADLSRAELGIAIMIREMIKPAELLLIDRPEGFIYDSQHGAFTDCMNTILKKRIPVVMHSNNNFINRFSEKIILIKQDRVTVS